MVKFLLRSLIALYHLLTEIFGDLVHLDEIRDLTESSPQSILGSVLSAGKSTVEISHFSPRDFLLSPFVQLQVFRCNR